MSSPSPSDEIAAVRGRTNRAQADAADPTASVWVGANAGTGKTHVLTNRVLRLLLAGTEPQRILCLTYTKAAAAEMSKRVFDKLARWVTSEDATLGKALAELLEREATDAERLRARALFTAAIETPGGLKVQTIHAFCERLLQRFPLEAGVSPSFTILDDETGRALMRQATDEVLTLATRDREAALGRALSSAIAFAVEDGFDNILRDALSRREWLEAANRLGRGEEDDLTATERLYRRHFGVRGDATAASLDAAMAELLTDAQLQRLEGVLSGGSKTDAKAAGVVGEILAASTNAARVEALADFFLTGEGEPRKSLMTKGLKTEHADLDALLTRTQDRFAALLPERRAIDAVTATMALIRLASAVMQRYREAKGRRAALDFDDLITHTRRLLASPNSAQWVLYKLDNGLDHILVDESQDTSPAQWDVIEALADEFFSGSGGGEKVRTIFAVGDEKQSIYSFQGAAPEMFARMGRHFRERAAAAAVTFREVPLNLSFRTVGPVLDTVDRVFADGGRTPGLTAGTAAVAHIANRIGQAGLVEIWPSEAHEDPVETDAFAPLDERAVASPVTRLADRIADTIKDWLARGEILQSERRPIMPGDILILVRRRNPFAPAMVAALKARRIAVAGADRIRLTEQIAVMDLMALGDFLTLPEDDLALATVLKSPLFDLDDDDLLGIAAGRKGTLWSALLERAKADPRLVEAAETLKRWRARADFIPPYEFFSTLIDRDGGRARMLARLGPDAADPIDEFLNLALTYDEEAPPSLQGFISRLKEDAREIKRDMEHGRNEVRIMTVHGAKGLEAGVVFLPDTCSNTSGRQPGSLLTLVDMERPEHVPPPFVWPVKGTSRLAPNRSAKAATEAGEAEERNRLLYVAMTRARDRLYVTGYEGRRGRAKGCWYDLITDGLGERAKTVELPDGRRVRRLESAQTAANEKPRHELALEVAAVPLPEWAKRPVAREPQLAVPLAPSRLAPYDVDDTGEPTETKSGAAAPPREQAAPSPRVLADTSRFLRGTITHALLEHLPTLPRTAWESVAQAFVDKRGAGLTAASRASIARETIAVLEQPAFAPLFGPQSRPEVPIAAQIAPPRGKGPPLRISGQIDRLAQMGDTVLIIDYKTNRPPPGRVEDVAEAYLFQLAAYGLAIEKIFAAQKVRAAILWTDGPRIMEIPQETLVTFQSRLWELASRTP